MDVARRAGSSDLSTPSTEIEPPPVNSQASSQVKKRKITDTEALTTSKSPSKRRKQESASPVPTNQTQNGSPKSATSRRKAPRKAARSIGEGIQNGAGQSSNGCPREATSKTTESDAQGIERTTAVKREGFEADRAVPVGEAASETTAPQLDKTPAKGRRRLKKEVGAQVKNEEAADEPTQSTTTKRKRKPKAEETGDDKPARDRTHDNLPDTEVDLDGEATTTPSKPKRKRKTAEEKALEAMPLAARTAGHCLNIGAHISAGGGVHNSITNAVHIGANAFALFLKSQRKWENPALKPEHALSFKSMCAEHKYNANKHVVPHGSYLVNLAAKDPEKSKQAYDAFVDDLRRCEELGITVYNFHPGNTNGEPREEALGRVAECLNRAHAETSTVVTLLENMAAGNNTIGGTFRDLRGIIDGVKDKSRVGVCLDTCHAFAAGYDLRSAEAFEATMKEFDDVIGPQYLKAVHMNDSKAPLNSRRDLHFNIGFGFLGLRAFWNVVNEKRFWGLPLVLETPIDEEKKDEKGKGVEDKSVWAREIKMLEGMVGLDPEGEEFKVLESELAAKGVKERSRLQEQIDRKANDMARKEAKGAGKKRKQKVKEEDGVSSGLSDAESV